MTREEARQFCDDTDIILDFYPPKFTFEDIQSFLKSWGYKLVGHEAMATVHIMDSNPGGEVWDTGRTKEEYRRRLFAVPIHDKVTFPDRVDSKLAQEMDFRTVFKRELKQRLFNVLQDKDTKQ